MAVAVQATPKDLLDSLIRRYLKDDLTVIEYVPFVVDALTHHRLLHDRNEQAVSGSSTGSANTSQNQSTQHRIWAQRVRALLESQQPGARWAGVCFVRVTAQQSASLFTDHVRTWVTLLVGMLSKPESVVNLEAIISTLSELFAKTAKRPDLKSDVSSKYLPDFHNHLLNHKDKKELLPTIFRALAQSVALFPTTFRLAVDKTEALCVAYMDGRFDLEPEIIDAAARCFAALHWAGGKNPNHPTERFTPSEQWRGNVQELIKAMHRCLNVLFSTVDEDKADENEMAGRNKYLTGMHSPAADAVQRYPQMFGRFSSLSKALVACLTCPTKDAVHLPLNNILALLTRVFDVNTKTPMSDARGVDSQEYFILISGISSLHIASNVVLRTLLATAQDHLVRHMSHLATIAIKSIRHTSGGAVSSSLRTSTYLTVESCIQAFGIPFVDMVQVPLMASLLEDLRMPSSRTVNPLELGAGGSNPNSRANNHTNAVKHKGGAGGSGGRNRRGGGQGGQGTMSTLNPLEDVVPAPVLIAALKVLSLMVTTSGPNLAPNARAAADTLVVTHLLNSQHHVNPIEQAETPFYTAAVRAQLYKMLVASISSPAETQSSLVSLSVGIFKAGLSDPEKHVRDSCLMALTICDLVMHSRLPPMQRARTVAPVPAPGERAVQDTGSALFGAFEVSKVNSATTADQNEIDTDEEEDEEDEQEDVEMQEQKVAPIPSSSAYGSSALVNEAAFKPQEQKVVIQSSVTVTDLADGQKGEKEEDEEDEDEEEEERIVDASINVTKTTFSSNTVSMAPATARDQRTKDVSASNTSLPTATTLTMTTSTMAVTSKVGEAGSDEDDDIVIPEINMEDDDDDDDDMDSD
ncbi:hypothetical protein BGZ99_008916 [Dissophora globulifera]|uniref:Pre-rRNA-processing protein RIX1 n=1 Tax=Dissophora globulifera TaxID=979702 RepID=A0A9P6UPB2_9FUNG|nr:hypothetical protein BGZ99_008916 [Dissophora globulifera]